MVTASRSGKGCEGWLSHNAEELGLVVGDT